MTSHRSSAEGLCDVARDDGGFRVWYFGVFFWYLPNFVLIASRLVPRLYAFDARMLASTSMSSLPGGFGFLNFFRRNLQMAC